MERERFHAFIIMVLSKSYTFRWLYVDNVRVVCQKEIRRDLLTHLSGNSNNPTVNVSVILTC